MWCYWATMENAAWMSVVRLTSPPLMGVDVRESKPAMAISATGAFMTGAELPASVRYTRGPSWTPIAVA